MSTGTPPSTELNGSAKATKTKASEAISKRQLRMGPAPFASFEDLSDEVRSQRLESPEDKQNFLIRLPGIHEDTTPGGSVLEISEADNIPSGISLIGAAVSLPSANIEHLPSAPMLAPCTPRIDISRASSSSVHEDSKDSTPENQAITALGLGFKEEGTLDLRSSTEELDFQDASVQKQAVSKSRPTSPLVFICDPNFDRQRKDSQTSEICLLSISGRTSRLSSIGSQCSDHSRISTTSHLSVMSGVSGASRSTSPHKMLLETSFCGSKSNLSELIQGTTTESKDGDDVLEKVLLARKHDPMEAILAEGITIGTPKISLQPNKVTKKSTKSPIAKPARALKPRLPSPKEPEVQTVSPKANLPIPTINIADTNQVTYLSPKGEKLTPGQVIKAQSGVEYVFVPLKGPLPMDFNKPSSVPLQRKKTREPRASSASATIPSQSTSSTQDRSLSHQSRKEPEYIRIKLKPDHMYKDNDQDPLAPPGPPIEKPTTLDFKPSTSYVPKTSSPPTTRRDSLIKSREISPTSNHKRKSSTFSAKDSMRDRSRGRSKSRDREFSPFSPALSSTESIDTKTNKKSSVFSIFKPKKVSKSSSAKSSAENLKIEFMFEPTVPSPSPVKLYELEGDSIRIPLHSPSEYENRSVLSTVQSLEEPKVQSEDSSVSEAPTVRKGSLKHNTSTSSENIVFSTKLGSNEEIFTTKLPKKGINLETIALVNDTPNIKSPEEIIPEPVVIKSPEPKEITPPKPEPEPISEQIEEKPTPEMDRLPVSDVSNRNSVISRDETSENSENDSELEFINKKKNQKVLEPDDNERKTLVFQTDSFEDELPYVPTTLPQERSVAVPIVPIKQRATLFEMKTRPIERPRSITPINPSCIDDYCGDTLTRRKNAEKLKISLPREDTIEKIQKLKSPRKGTNQKSWQEFAEKGISSHQSTPSSGGSHHAPDSGDEIPPPLPPRSAPKEQIKSWINFEEIPEKQKPPKRIQTIPTARHVDQPTEAATHACGVVQSAPGESAVIYNYVNPEDCQCECHETTIKPTPIVVPTEEIEPLLQDDDSSDETMKQSSSSSSHKTKR